jgi:hypothetical protein
MVDLFWRRRLKKQERGIVLNLPNLPDDIDDNMFIASGVAAAEQDKQSGAYDEFMFSEDGYASMPYEDSVDEFVTLLIERTPERKGRAELPHRLRLEYFKSRVERRRKDVEEAQAQLENVKALVQTEDEILAGETTGEGEGNWRGVRPDVTSKSKHAFRKMMGWIIFVLVGIVDAFVIFLSLRLLTDTEQEALFFTIPAVGVQILFPHLVGRAFAKIKSKSGKPSEDWSIAIGVGVSWLIYVFAMTIIRINFLKNSYFEAKSEEMPGNLEFATFVLSLFILIGLGSWLMIRAMSENPHEEKYSRLRFVTLSKTRRLNRALKALSKAEADVAAEETALAEVSAQWDNRAKKYPELAESAKSAYRRALVNQAGTPDFTTTYLPKERPFSKRNRRD